MKTTNPRREFFKQVLFYTSAGALVNVLARNVSFAADPELLPIDMSKAKRKDPANAECVASATGLGYVDDLAKALKEKKIVKADRPGKSKVFKPADQTCDTCMFYNWKKDGKATCQLIPKCLVAPKGSCNSWAEKV